MADFRRTASIGNPLANGVTIVFGVLAFIVAFSFGIVLLGVFLAVIAVLASIISIRLWWFKRKLRAHMAGQPASKPSSRQGTTIETEYEVLDDEHRRSPK